MRVEILATACLFLEKVTKWTLLIILRSYKYCQSIILSSKVTKATPTGLSSQNDDPNYMLNNQFMNYESWLKFLDFLLKTHTINIHLKSEFLHSKNYHSSWFCCLRALDTIRHGGLRKMASRRLMTLWWTFRKDGELAKGHTF